VWLTHAASVMPVDGEITLKASGWIVPVLFHCRQECTSWLAPHFIGDLRCSSITGGKCRAVSSSCKRSSRDTALINAPLFGISDEAVPKV
jgi:hypothetical protein